MPESWDCIVRMKLESYTIEFNCYSWRRTKLWNALKKPDQRLSKWSSTKFFKKKMQRSYTIKDRRRWINWGRWLWIPEKHTTMSVSKFKRQLKRNLIEQRRSKWKANSWRNNLIRWIKRTSEEHKKKDLNSKSCRKQAKLEWSRILWINWKVKRQRRVIKSLKKAELSVEKRKKRRSWRS